MNETEEKPVTETEEQAPPAEGMRRLHVALGGDEVPSGPLGGPTPKSRERLLAEQELDEEESRAAEREAIDAAKEDVAADREAAAERPSEPAPEPAPSPSYTPPGEQPVSAERPVA